jgi:DNA polymerase (family 10)
MSIADLLDLAGERFKPEAYRRAARSVESLPEPLSAVERRGELEQIPGIGEAIAEKIREFLRTRHISYYDRLRTEFPAGLVDLMQLPGIGPKTARRFWTELGVEGPLELAQAIDAGRLSTLKGFGPKKIEQFRAAVAQYQQGGRPARTPLLEAAAIAREILEALRTGGSVEHLETAGSLRRRRETVGDLDVLATSPDPESVLRRFTHLPDVAEVKLAGGTKATVVYRGGVQVDLRVVEPKSFGAALQYFTGSKDHNIHLRTIARDQGLKINEYGVFRGDAWVAGRTEEEVYGALGLTAMAPEIRENQGEIEAAQRRALPPLVSPSDVGGLLHVHLPAGIDVPALEVLLRSAARRWAYLGVVAGGDRQHEVSDAVWERLVRSRGEGSPLKLYLAREGSVAPSNAGRDDQQQFDFWILDFGRVTDGRPPSRDGLERPLLVAHPGAVTDTGTAMDALRTRNPWNGAIDVSPEPGADGFDSSVIRQWASAGGRVAISTAGTDPLDPTRLEIAVGLARRGWLRPDLLLNGRSFDIGRPTFDRASGHTSKRTPKK